MCFDFYIGLNNFFYNNFILLNKFILLSFCVMYIRSLKSEPNIFLTWGFKDQEDVAYSPSRLAWSANFNCSCFYRSNNSAELLHFVAKVIHLI